MTDWNATRKEKKRKKGVYFLTRIDLHATNLLKIIICHFHLRLSSGTLSNAFARLNFLSIPFSHLERNIFLIKIILYQSFFLAISFPFSLFNCLFRIRVESFDSARVVSRSIACHLVWLKMFPSCKTIRIQKRNDKPRHLTQQQQVSSLINTNTNTDDGYWYLGLLLFLDMLLSSRLYVLKRRRESRANLMLMTSRRGKERIMILLFSLLESIPLCKGLFPTPRAVCLFSPKRVDLKCQVGIEKRRPWFIRRGALLSIFSRGVDRFSPVEFIFLSLSRISSLLLFSSLPINHQLVLSSPLHDFREGDNRGV